MILVTMYINHHHRNQPPVNHKPHHCHNIHDNPHHLLCHILKYNGQVEYLPNGFNVVAGHDWWSCNIEEQHVPEVEDVAVKVLVDRSHGLQRPE